MRELMFAQGTAFTHTFNGDSGSWVARKLELADALPSAAAGCGLVPWGLVLVGPVGPMWSYAVYGFFQDGQSVVLNTIHTTHGRIIRKGTVRLTVQEADSRVTRFLAVAPVVAGRPVLPDSTTDPLRADFSYDLLASRYASPAKWWHGRLDGASDTASYGRVDEALRSLVRGIVDTYAHIK